jgi:hypothetical protein
MSWLIKLFMEEEIKTEEEIVVNPEAEVVAEPAVEEVTPETVQDVPVEVVKPEGHVVVDGAVVPDHTLSDSVKSN